MLRHVRCREGEGGISFTQRECKRERERKVQEEKSVTRREREREKREEKRGGSRKRERGRRARAPPHHHPISPPASSAQARRRRSRCRTPRARRSCRTEAPSTPPTIPKLKVFVPNPVLIYFAVFRHVVKLIGQPGVAPRRRRRRRWPNGLKNIIIYHLRDGR
jgi:hypothetical protein